MTVDLVLARETEHKRARLTIYLLYACLALDIIAIATGLAQRALLLRALTGEGYTHEEGEANDARYSAVGRLQLLAFIITGIVWLIWLHRAYSNLGAMGTRKSRFTPGWAVGYWFIPFVNLVRPYQIVVDLWRRSEGLNTSESVEHLPRPSVISWWWGVYLLSGVVGRLFASLAREASSVNDFITSTDVGMFADGIAIVSAILAISVVRGIDERQQRFDPQT